MSKVTIGCDPEFFLVYKDTGTFRSAHDLLPGNKAEPFKLKYGAVQVDGMAVEFNIDPVETWTEFKHHVYMTLKEIRKMVSKEFSFYVGPVIYFSERYYESLPDKTKELGCDPDLDAYNEGKRNQIPFDPRNMRTGSGHFHLGWNTSHYTNNEDRLFDAILLAKKVAQTIPLAPYDSPIWRIERERRTMYGKKGSFRVKPYGVEFREFSNVWLSSPVLAKGYFDIIKKIGEGAVLKGNLSNAELWLKKEQVYQDLSLISWNPERLVIHGPDNWK